MAEEEKEEWRAIPGYPNYEASSLGRIRSNLKHNRYPLCDDGWRIKKPTKHRSGYLNIRLSPGRKVFLVHRLVLYAFIGQCPDGFEALHGNDIRTDNRISNLKWGTKKENAQQIILHNRRGIIKLNPTQVRIIRRCRELNISSSFLGEIFGVNGRTIRDAMVGKTWSYA